MGSTGNHVNHFRDESLKLGMFLVRDSRGAHGISIGGCRVMNYSTVERALEDAASLARKMTLKYRCLGIGFGGLKAVVYELDATRRASCFQRIGDWIEQFGGSCYLGCDVGSTDTDMQEIAKSTRYVLDLPDLIDGGTFGQLLAIGVCKGLRAALVASAGDESFDGRSAFVIGLGKAGSEIARHLIAAGCEVYGTDRNDDRLKSALSLGVVPHRWTGRNRNDFIVPCGDGGSLSLEDASLLDARIVGGAENSPMQEGVEDFIFSRGILYAPDFIISSGAVVLDDRIVSGQRGTFEEGVRRLERIPELLDEVFRVSKLNHCTTSEAALRIVGMDS